MNDIALTVITLIVTVVLGLCLQENRNLKNNEKTYAEIAKMNNVLLSEHYKIIEFLNSAIERANKDENKRSI
ncbi:hypothetical protein HZI73_22500 [Vallitalea pronyensis]|uniref:Uncharacterized protein n=1 Tax=Vallitalea pronyensis TaxID=1348613 RepID=A0A8J8MNN3_9FIRM|nr:hypothetical protein [Vallitalea pronyensis]QUI24901.1 hypothetical protein HZI73_22500 [Vallitalea pronyensis]